MADVSYRFAGIPDGVTASVEDVTDPGVEVTTVTGGSGGYGDATLPIGDYVARYTYLGEAHRIGGDLAASRDSDLEHTAPSADTVTYDNTTSSLTATDVQAAIDELTARIVALETP
jgi:hypothetical protein